MRSHQDEIEALGAGIVAVGTGNRAFAEAFVRDEEISFPVLIDDDGQAAKALQLANTSVISLLKPSVFAGRSRARAAGHVQKRSGPRVLQLGATLVVAPGGKLLYEYRDADTADHVPMNEVLEALEAWRGDGSGHS